MPPISEISSVPIANIGKIFGVSTSSVAKFSAQYRVTPVVGTFPYLNSLYLDGSNDQLQSGTTAAYGSQPVADFGDVDIMMDADAAWSIEMDLLIHLNSTQQNAVFSYYPSGAARYIIYVSKSGTTNWFIKLFHLNNLSKQFYVRPYWNITNDTHLTVNAQTGVWHRISICKGTSADMEDVNMYIDGMPVDGGTSQWRNHTDYEYDDEDQTSSTRYLVLGEGGSDTAIGMFSFYNKQLSLAEVNENYDGGARTSGSADVTEIMVQDARETSTSGNLKHYLFFDPAEDSSTNIVAKVGSLDFVTANSTTASLSLPTNPQVPILSAGSPPAAVYATEGITLTQPSSAAGTIVSWYSDSGYSTLVNTGSDYSFTVPSAGAHNLYVKETKTWPVPYGAVEQTVDFSYTSVNAGYSEASFISNLNAEATGKALVSPVFAGELFEGGNISWTMWHANNHQYSYRKIITAGNYSIQLGGWQNSYPVIVVQNSETTYYWNASSAGTVYNTTEGEWNHTTFSWDVDTGTIYAWANGVSCGSYQNENLTTAMNAGEEDNYYWNTPANWYNLKVANFAIYGNVLTNAEALAINHGGDPGDSLNLAGLDSADKLVEYWPINDDTLNNESGDVLTGVVSATEIPVPNSVAARKSTDRP